MRCTEGELLRLRGRMIDMEPIIFAAFVLETALLIPLLIVGYCDRKKYKA